MDEILDFPMEDEMKKRIKDAVEVLSMYSTAILTAVGFVEHPSMKEAVDGLAKVTREMSDFIDGVSDYSPTQADAYRFMFILSDNMPNITKTDAILRRLGIAIVTDIGHAVPDHLANLCTF